MEKGKRERYNNLLKTHFMSNEYFYAAVAIIPALILFLLTAKIRRDRNHKLFSYLTEDLEKNGIKGFYLLIIKIFLFICVMIFVLQIFKIISNYDFS